MACLQCLLLGLALTGLAAAKTAPDAGDPWQLGLAYAFNEAEQVFARGLRGDPADRRAQLGRAAALLNVQPRSADRVAEARTLLAKIAAADGHDDTGATARYLLARIADAHQEPRDPPAAARLYRSLLAEDTAHPLAQAAGVKLALILLYDEEAAGLEARFAAAEALLAQVTQPAARSDLLVILGRSALYFRRPPGEALRRFAAARTLGFSLRSVEADTLVALSDLAVEAGDTALARDCLTEFVHAFPRDNRCAWLRRRLAGLPPPS